ncbi:MAG: hypothetical protein AB1Z65_02015, partial [Candidatus Sulfomarinibacteraceae bacterium]
MKVKTTMTLGLAALVLAGGAADVRAADPLLRQDPEVLRFVERSIPWYPGSVFSVVSDETTATPS